MAENGSKIVLYCNREVLAGVGRGEELRLWLVALERNRYNGVLAHIPY